MLKANKILTAGLIGSAVFAVSTMTGCRMASIPVAVTVPGEFNLSGVSKIAMVDFNSLPDDPTVGVFSADKETGSNFCNPCRFLSVFKLLILFYFEFFFQLSAKYACCHFPGCIARIALRIAIRQTPTSATSAIHISA